MYSTTNVSCISCGFCTNSQQKGNMYRGNDKHDFALVTNSFSIMTSQGILCGKSIDCSSNHVQPNIYGFLVIA